MIEDKAGSARSGPPLANANPVVTIVTPSLNMARYLPQAIESVLSQDYSPVEYLVMDGGSTDGSLEILNQYKTQYRAKLHYDSAPDDGPAEAIHRGFARARGDIFAWLNADDVYSKGAVRMAASYFESHPEVDIVYGDGCWIDAGGKVIGRYPTLSFDARALERRCFICQPAAFFRASAYRRCGLDSAQAWSFDYDLWIRMAKQNFRFAYIPECLAYSRMHVSALTIRERENVFRGSMELLKRHYGYVPLSLVLSYIAYRSDGRDQFFEPFQPSLRNYLASLPAGLRHNRRKPFRYFAEWLKVPGEAVARRLR